MRKWIIAADEAVYDHAKAFDKWGYIDWGVNAIMEVGDLVYIYFRTPIRKIRYKTEVVKTNIKFENITEDESFWLKGNGRNPKSKYVRLKYIDRIDDDSLSYENLKKHGITSRLQANEEIKIQELYEYIDNQFDPCLLAADDRIISFPCSSTYEIVRKTCIHAHPVKNHPNDIPRYLMIRAKGGLSEEIYRIDKQFEINPLDEVEVNAFVGESYYNDLLEYIRYRKRKYPFKNAPEPYRFYVLKNVYKLKPNYVLEPNIQKHKYLCFSELNQFGKRSKNMSVVDILKGYHQKFSDSDIQLSLAQAAISHRKFINDFPKDSIKNLSLEDYLISKKDGAGKENSFCRRVRYDMDVMGHMGNVYYDVFGVYLNGGFEISLSDSLEKKFDNDYIEAFKYIKGQIIKLFDVFDKKEYDKVASVDLNKSFKYRLLMIYYPNDFFPVCTEKTLNGYCDHFGITYSVDDEPIYRNIELVKKKNSIKEIKDWTNHQVMGLIDWMWRSDIFLKDESNEIIYDSIEESKYEVTLDEIEASEEVELLLQRDLEKILSVEESREYFEYVPVPEERKEVIDKDNKSGVSTYPRDPQKRVNALKRSKFVCEYNPEHESFISKKTNMRYVETHHLIPLEYWGSFENSLDVEANIVCLCSNCHNEIHYGKFAINLIKPLYEKRKKELEEAGIEINIEDLADMYEGKFVK